MAVKRYYPDAQAYGEILSVPKRYDASSGAYVETTGKAYDQTSGSWTERWGQKVSAYVYGAASETVTIKKNGIIVATVATNSSGCSNEKISLGYGTYTLTGSVSEWTEEQTVDKNTEKFRAMPEGALYWYGNIKSEEICPNNGSQYSINQTTNSMLVKRAYVSNSPDCVKIKNMNQNSYSTIHMTYRDLTNTNGLPDASCCYISSDEDGYNTLCKGDLKVSDSSCSGSMVSYRSNEYFYLFLNAIMNGHAYIDAIWMK